MGIKQKYDMFQKLLDANHKAMDSLFNIRESALKSDKGGVMKAYVETLDNIKNMADVYCKMKEGGGDDITKKISEVEHSTIGVITRLEMLLNFEYDKSSLVDFSLKELADKVENLTGLMQDPANEQFSVSNIKTVHDLIRYLHQEAIEAMFSIKKEGFKEDAVIRYNFFNKRTIEINYLDLGGGIDNKSGESDIGLIKCKPFKELLKGIPQKIEQNLRNVYDKTMWVFFSENFLDLNITMGTHIANITALVDDRGANYIKFMFKEWCTDGRKQARMGYLSQILKKLGFKVNFQSSSIDAKIEGVTAEKSGVVLQNFGRLLVTTDNLDWALVNPKQEENKEVLEKAVQRFMEGNYNIVDYAMDTNPKPYRKN